MTDQTELHNRLAGEAVTLIVKPILKSGGQFSDVLVLLESVIFGVMLTGMKLGWDNAAVLDEVMAHVKERLAEQRLAKLNETEGKRGG